MSGIARVEFDQLKENKVLDAPVVSWVVFERALIGFIILCELKESKKREFLTLHTECVSVREYMLMFTQLSCYDPKMVADIRSRMSLFVVGLSYQSSKEGKEDIMIGDKDLARLMIHV